MRKVNQYFILDGVTGTRWNKIPVLFIHGAYPETDASLVDAAMQAGAVLVNTSNIVRLGARNPKVFMAIGRTRIDIEIQRKDGTSWISSWDMDEKDSAWRQLCFDKGGLVLSILSSPEPEYLKSLRYTNVQTGENMVLCPTVSFPRNQEKTMPKYRVHFVQQSDVSMIIESDVVITEENGAADKEAILEEAYQEGVPSLCAQCSGWGRNYSRDLGDELEVVEDDNKQPLIELVEE